MSKNKQEATDIVETPASDTLAPMSRSGMVANAVQVLNTVDKDTLVSLYNQVMAQFGPNAENGVPSGTAEKNKAGITAKASAAVGSGPMNVGAAANWAGIKEDVAELFAGTELTEEFKSRVETVFEAAVNARVGVELARINEEAQESLEEAIAEFRAETEDKIDQYLTHAITEWVADNQLAIDTGLRNQIQESFVAGLKNLFEEHYIDIPEEKVNVVEEMSAKMQKLQEDLDDALRGSIAARELIESYERKEIVSELSAGLAQSQAERFKTLAENVSFDTAETYKNKLVGIKETMFKSTPNNPTTASNDASGVPLLEEVDTAPVVSDPHMRNIIAAIGRGAKAGL
jgi:hypothetical protein